MENSLPKFKGINLGAIFGPYIGGIILIAIGYVMILRNNVSFTPNVMMGGLVIFIGFAAVVVGAVFYYIMLYRAWCAIQDMEGVPPRTTPGKAVGFLFIPFFNLYWMFVAIYGLAQDYNSYIAQKGYKLPQMTAGLFLASCILQLCTIVPFLGSFAAIGYIVVVIIVWVQIGTRLNALVQLKNNE